MQDGAPGGEGSPGQDASVVFLTNENVTFAGNKDGKVAATTKTCHVVAYTGTTKVTPTVGTPTGMPTGMTITVGSATDNEIPLTIAIAANSTLGAAGQLNGVVSVPVTAPVETTLGQLSCLPCRNALGCAHCQRRYGCDHGGNRPEQSGSQQRQQHQRRYTGYGEIALQAAPLRAIQKMPFSISLASRLGRPLSPICRSGK